MPAEWPIVGLGEVLKPVKRPVAVESDAEYRMLGIRWYGNGAFLKDSKSGSEIAARRLNAVEPGDITYSKLFAWKGSFAVVPEACRGAVASSEFPTYVADASRLLPEYFALWAGRDEIWDAANDMSTGTTAGSRNRLAPEDFLELGMELPSVDLQKKIISSVETVRVAEASFRREALASMRAHYCARRALIERSGGEPIALSEVVTGIEGGKSPRCLDRPPVEEEFGVLKVSAIRDGLFRPDEAKALPPGIEPWQQVVEAGDLLYSRANTSTLVGALCRVAVGNPRLLLCDKTMRITIDEERLDPDYLVEAMGVPSAREHLELMAGGTSDSMKNISQTAYLETEINLQPLELQRSVVRRLGALRRVSSDALRVADRLGRMRTALVEELLAGSRPVPSAG